MIKVCFLRLAVTLRQMPNKHQSAPNPSKAKVKIKILVLGGHGFIGRHGVSALREAGAEVRIGSRNGGTLADPVLRVRLQERLSVEDWVAIADSFDVVLNCVGILRQRPGERYEAIHHLAPAALAAACAPVSYTHLTLPTIYSV